MAALVFTLLAPLSLLLGCPGVPCDCVGVYSDAEIPSGEFDIDADENEPLAGGVATFTEDTVTFRYTDADGNEWEVEYTITE